MSLIKYIMVIVGASLGLTVLLFIASLLPVGRRATTPLETIRGVPYPMTGQTILVEESLAHTDVQLREPVLGKTLVLDFRYNPGATKNLAVGVRMDAFWLSYPFHHFYQASANPVAEWQEATIEIPLTGALQDTDRSVDVMFVAEPETDIVQLVEQPTAPPSWEIADLQAQVQYDWPTLSQFKDYVRSAMQRERAL